MSVLGLMVRELRYRVTGFISSLVAVVAAVAVFVAVATMSQSAQRETVRLMRNLGFNLLILPSSVKMTDFWSRGYARAEMPEDYVYKLAKSGAMSFRHLVARLQQAISWRGQTVLLTGILPEVPMAHKQPKPPMGLRIERGSAYVGSAIASELNIKKGQVIDIRGHKLRVTRCLPEKGSQDDIRIYAHLHDVQEILKRPNRINEIEALGCLCFGRQDIDLIRAEVSSTLPDVQVVQLRTIAQVRVQTRRMMEKYGAVLVPLAVLAAGLWVFLQALGNVRERRAEIGILRALGVDGARIAALFLSKAALLGLIGGAIGYVLGTAVALHIGPQIFLHTAKKIEPIWSLLGWGLLLSLGLCIIASYIPALMAVTQDPAEVLRQE